MRKVVEAYINESKTCKEYKGPYKVGDYLKVKLGNSFVTYQINDITYDGAYGGKKIVTFHCTKIALMGKVYKGIDAQINADSPNIKGKLKEPLSRDSKTGKIITKLDK